MVKKNLVNKNVVRALSIGLSLAMASQPLTAMAAGETSDTPTTEPVEGSPVAGPADDAKEEKPATQAAEVMGEAVDIKDTFMPVVAAIQETNDAIDAVNAANAQAPLQIELGVNKEAADLSREADSNFNHISDVAEKDLALTGDLAGAVAQDFIKDNLESQVEDKVDARNKTLTNEEKTGVNDIVDKADELLDNTEETLTAAEQQLETSKDIIANTSDPAVAGPAYEAAKQKVDEANDAVNKAETDLAQLESDYAEAETKFNDADEEYRTLKGQYENAYNAYISYVNAAGRDAQSLDRELERLEKEANDLYKAANAAKERVDFAKGMVDRAKAATEAGKKALEKQKEELQKSKYAELKALEDKLNARVDDNETVYNPWTHKTVEINQENDPTFGDKTGVQKGTYDEYFDKVVELYYIPEVIKGEFVSLKWNKDNSNNDIYNYCDVTYKVVENGKTVTKTVKLNYKLKEANDKHEFGGLVIFEKTEHFYFNQDELTEAERAEIDEKGAIDKGNYVVRKNSKGEYVAFTDKNDPWAIKDAEYHDFFGNDVEVDVDEKSTEVTWNYFNGILTRTVKADVTTTTFTDKTLDAMSAATSTLENESAAKQAFVDAINSKINALTAGQTLLITVGDEEIEVAKGTVVTLETAAQYGYVSTSDPTKSRHVEDWQEETVGYKVSGVYSTYFTDTVTIYDDGFKSRSSAETWGNYTYDNYDASKDDEHNWRKNTGWFNLGLIGGYYYGERTIGQEANNDLTVSSYWVDEGWFTSDWHKYYQYSGTYTVNYEKYTSMQADYFELFKAFNTRSKEQVIEGVKQKIAEKGGVYIGVVNHDMNAGKLTILYTPAAGRVTDVEIMETDTTKLEDELKKTISGNVGRVQITGMTAIINRVDKG
ncbi:MAG: hypothetical protein J5537_03440, partial [Lachnospiraceae bacterium]|nr:hypothetical protein [Lachnospiraceae bacterium]